MLIKNLCIKRLAKERERSLESAKFIDNVIKHFELNEVSLDEKDQNEELSLNRSLSLPVLTVDDVNPLKFTI